MKLSKTNYLIWRDCAKNAWLKVHKPDIYYEKPLSVFDEGIIETGNEIDILARDLFAGGVLIENRDGSEDTKELIAKKTRVIYQPVFETKQYKMVSDILAWNESQQAYDLYEVKASNSGDDKKAKNELYSFDIAFQYLVLKELGVPINRLFLARLNGEYERGEELELEKLFSVEDFTENVKNLEKVIAPEMEQAYDFLKEGQEPFGNCKCITRGRSSHCTTFAYANPEVPEYSVHDISRIGSSKRKLEELVDSGILDIHHVPDEFPLTPKQKNQVDAVKSGKIYFDKSQVQEFLEGLKEPISFLDYETYASAIPRFQGYSPFNQIPFQYSLHIYKNSPAESQGNQAGTENEHKEFIFTENQNPDVPFLEALKRDLPSEGGVVVWSKAFEIGRNKDLAKRNPEYQDFIQDLNSRIIDLMDVFTNQYFVHPGFKGKTSIKYILPVLAPELSYKVLNISEGATASNTWNEIVKGKYTKEEASDRIEDLKVYCKLDTHAMFMIWKYLKDNI